MVRKGVAPRKRRVFGARGFNRCAASARTRPWPGAGSPVPAHGNSAIVENQLVFLAEQPLDTVIGFWFVLGRPAKPLLIAGAEYDQIGPLAGLTAQPLIVDEVVGIRQRNSILRAGHHKLAASYVGFKDAFSGRKRRHR